MNKEKELEQLFKEWEINGSFEPKGQRGQFIKDGIVCLDKYEASSPKVLFVLKDTDDQNPEITFERGICDEVLESNNSGLSWNRIAEWSRALTSGDNTFVNANTLKMEATEDSTEKDGMRKYFKRVSIMNLKKASGKGSITDNELKNYVSNDKLQIENIRKEIKIINPDIIIACSRIVFELLEDVIFEKDIKIINENIEFSSNMSSYGESFELSQCSDNKKTTYIVSYCHPNNRGKGSCTAEEHYQNMLKIRNSLLKQ